MASYQSVVNINIIMKFLIGHKAFVSLCTTLPYATKPQTLEELRNQIEHAINDIPLAIIQTLYVAVFDVFVESVLW